MSNHDEERAVEFFGSWYRSDAAALLTYTLPGLRFFWMGDFEGFSHQLDVHLRLILIIIIYIFCHNINLNIFRREQSEPENSQVYNFYQSLLSIVNTPVFKQGQWEFMNVQGDNSPLIAIHWYVLEEREK